MKSPGATGGSLAEEFARFGVHFEPAQKGGRIAVWQIMKRLLANAGRPDKPGLYVSRACRYWWHRGVPSAMTGASRTSIPTVPTTRPTPDATPAVVLWARELNMKVAF